MDSKDFFVTLPSNVSSTAYFENSIGNYRTKLHKRVELNGLWEIGLYEISYPKSWFNIIEPFSIRFVDSINIVQSKITISPGMYYDENAFVAAINEQIAGNFGKTEYNLEIIYPPSLSISASRKTVTVHPGFLNGGSFIYPIFDKKLVSILGLNKSYDISTEDDFKMGKTIKATEPIDISIFNTSLYVYCDVVHPNIVGDTYTKLLRVVENPKEKGFAEQIVIKYQNPQYLPLLLKNFETIEIDIKDEYNKTIPFKFGSVIVTLHFRKYDI